MEDIKGQGRDRIRPSDISHIRRTDYALQDLKLYKLAWHHTDNAVEQVQGKYIQQGANNVPWYNILQGCAYKYCSLTTLHGFRLIERNTPLKHKIIIGIAILLTLLDAVLVMKFLIQNFFSSTILRTVEIKPTYITEIPFPAITICPLNQIRPSVLNYSELLSKPQNQLSPEEQTHLDYAEHICNFIDKHSINDYFDSGHLRSLLKKQRKFCSEDIVELHWLGKKLDPPCRYMQPTLTYDGVCYAFNLLPIPSLLTEDFNSKIKDAFTDYDYILKNLSNSWATDTGYVTNKNDLSTIPWRTRGFHHPNMVKFILNFNHSDYNNWCSVNSKGFKVYVHLPLNIPTKTSRNTYVDIGEKVTIRVLPEISKTSDKLRTWRPNIRNCYYQDERKLYFYKHYTQENCYKECETNATRDICGCVAFYQPRDETMPICGADLVKCIAKKQVQFLQMKDSEECNCLPGCFDIKYKLEESGGRVVKNSQHARLEVMFQKKRVVALLQTTLLSGSEVLANFGGVMTLNLGFSIVSLLEIIYFLTARLITIIWNFKRNHKLVF